MYFAHLTLQGGQFDGAIINGDNYMVTKHIEMSWLVSSKCPHRGGPLHLGCETDDKIYCPWHGHSIRKASLAKNALPYLRVGNKVIILSENLVESVMPLKTNLEKCKSIR